MNERKLREFDDEQHRGVADMLSIRDNLPLTVTQQLYEQLAPEVMNEFRQYIRFILEVELGRNVSEAYYWIRHSQSKGKDVTWPDKFRDDGD